jgi:hypothetical protein
VATVQVSVQIVFMGRSRGTPHTTGVGSEAMDRTVEGSKQMYDANDFQVRYSDHRRQMTWVNDQGWKFDAPTTRKGVRAIVAQALIAFAARLTTTMKQPHTA